MAMRVPVPDGSVTDLVATVLGRDVTIDEINAAFRAAADDGPLANGRLDYSEDPLVSSDIVGSPASCTFDALSTMAIGQRRQDRRLVRQRVGLLEPAGRPRRAGRVLAVGVALRTLDELGDVAGRRVSSSASTSTSRSRTARSTDDLRIRASLPTIRELLDAGRSIVAASHLGRPKGAVDDELRLAPVARSPRRAARPRGRMRSTRSPARTSRPSRATSTPARSCCSRTCASIPARRRTTRPSRSELARLADVYVDDAFGAVHRAHASRRGAARADPADGRPAVAGRLIQRGGRGPLAAARRTRRGPYVAVLGGAKVSDKLAHDRAPSSSASTRS